MCSVRVPAESRDVAVVELSFDNCPAGRVPPSTFRIPIKH